MDIYLPDRRAAVNLFLVLGLGGAVGFLSGMFGVGGGFLMTPLLILLGVPAAVAVATQAPQILASSVSGRAGPVPPQGRRRQDGLGPGRRRPGRLVRRGHVFAWLKPPGPCRPVRLRRLRPVPRHRAGYARREPRHALRGRRPPPSRAGTSTTGPTAGRSRCASPPPASTSAPSCRCGRRLRRPARRHPRHRRRLRHDPGDDLHHPHAGSVVIGTSLFQICFVSAATTFLHAYENGTVDILLALLLIAGGVVGAQFGTRAGS